MKILKDSFICLLWAIGGVGVIVIYIYSKILYFALILATIILTLCIYRKAIKELYIEIFKDLGIDTYYQLIKQKIGTLSFSIPNIFNKRLIVLRDKLGLW